MVIGYMYRYMLLVDVNGSSLCLQVGNIGTVLLNICTYGRVAVVRVLRVLSHVLLTHYCCCRDCLQHKFSVYVRVSKNDVGTLVVFASCSVHSEFP